MQTSKVLGLTVSLLGITSVGALAQTGAQAAPTRAPQPAGHGERSAQGVPPRYRVQPVKPGTFLQIRIGKPGVSHAGKCPCCKRQVSGKARGHALTPAQRKAMHAHRQQRLERWERMTPAERAQCKARLHKKWHAR